MGSNKATSLPARKTCLLNLFLETRLVYFKTRLKGSVKNSPALFQHTNVIKIISSVNVYNKCFTQKTVKRSTKLFFKVKKLNINRTPLLENTDCYFSIHSLKKGLVVIYSKSLLKTHIIGRASNETSQSSIPFFLSNTVA